MKTAFHLATLPWIVALAAVPMSALAQDEPPADAPLEVPLDMDHDGRMDRAVVVQDPDSGEAVLTIYLAGDQKLDPSRKPTFVKKAVTEGRILELAAKGKGSLAITSCFGCGANKSWEETLTIVYRGGKFLVAGFSRNWDWNVQKADGSVETTLGSCDINYLTGKGIASQDLSDGRKIHAQVAGKLVD
jgi:hypothetical protein